MQVYYFTRTQKSKRIAEQIAKQQGCSAYLISDSRDWSGKVNFIKAGAMAAKHETLAVTYPPALQNEPMILVFPIWAATLPPAIRQFVSEQKAHEIIAVVVSAITTLGDAERSLFTQCYEVKGRCEIAPEITQERI